MTLQSFLLIMQYHSVLLYIYANCSRKDHLAKQKKESVMYKMQNMAILRKKKDPIL